MIFLSKQRNINDLYFFFLASGAGLPTTSVRNLFSPNERDVGLCQFYEQKQKDYTQRHEAHEVAQKKLCSSS
jgi:hypothetical protein